MLRLLAIAVMVATLALPGTARAASSFTILPPQEVLEAMPAYRYVRMTNEQAYAELDRRKISYRKVGPVRGVRAPVRLTGKLRGVNIHSVLPEDERAESIFEILDARLALTLDDFAGLLERHDIVEVVHFTMYRPNLPRPDAAGSDGSAPKGGPSTTGKGAKATEAPASRPEVGKKGSVVPTKGRKVHRRGHKQKSLPEANRAKAAKAKATKTADKRATKTADKRATKAADKRATKRAVGAKHSPASKDGRRTASRKKGPRRSRPVATSRPPSKPGSGPTHGAKGRPTASSGSRAKSRRSPKHDPAPEAAAEPPKKKVSWAPPGTRHPAGLAIDVGGLRKRDGRWLGVAHHFGGRIGAQTCGPGASRPASTEARELWSIVCEVGDLGIFTYVLTPNYDEPHADHFHMEIRPDTRWVLFH